MAEFQAGRIPGAQFFDLDQISDPATTLPHMLPSEAAFAAAAVVLGISGDDAVVVYDHLGAFSAPRAWWTWRVFGHPRWGVGGSSGVVWGCLGSQVES